MIKNYYSILGVKQSATLEEIKTAYKKLASNVHPDEYLNRGLSSEEIQKSEEKIKEINEAYEVLKNPKKRSDYDCEWIAYRVSQAQEKNKRLIKNNLRKNAKRIKKCQQKRKTIKEIYKDIKQSERRSFVNRHKKVNRMYDKAYASANSIPQKVIFNFGKGTVHVMHEAFYQFSKIKKNSDDSLPKYILKNRKFFATIGLAVLIKGFSGEQVTPPEENIMYSTDNINYTSETVKKPVGNNIKVSEEEKIIILNKKHRIKSGDTLYQMSVDSATDEYTLRVLNDIPSSLIYIGDSMLVPYRVNIDDLEHYTKTVKVENNSIYELACKYKTDAETIYNLNKESIQKFSSNYIILSDEIVVPKFISRDELQEKKNASKEIVQLVK